MIGMFDQNRPSIRIRPDRFDAFLEVVAAVLLIYTMIHLGAYYGQLPERIPIHYNAAGQPDGWAMRGSIFILTGAKVFLYILLTGVSFLPPRYYNIPWTITEENAARQYRLVLRLVRIMKVEILALFFFIHERTIAIAIQGSGSLPAWFLPVFLGTIFGTIGWYFVMSYRAR